MIYAGEAVARYLLGALLGLDHLGNALLGGDPRETISSRLGRIEAAHGGRIPWTRPLARLTAWALDRVDRDHCREAVIEGAGDGGLVDRPSGPLPWAPPPDRED